jgi:importin subunit beta-1
MNTNTAPIRNQVNELVGQTFFNPDHSTRENSEKLLLQLRTQDPLNFFTALTQNFADPSLPTNDRVLNSTLLLKSLTENTNNNTYWYFMPSELKEQIQNSGLSLLIDSNYTIQKSAASLISKIYILRYQADQKWVDLLENLSKNSQSPKPEIKKASIYTIGYICEELSLLKFNLDPSEIQQILEAICFCINKDQSDDSIRIAGLKALQHSHFYFSTIMQDSTIRNFVMDLLVKCTIIAQNSDEVIMLGYSCLVDISKTLYPYLATYIGKICEFTIHVLEAGSDQCKIPAIELWNAIAIEENRRKGLANGDSGRFGSTDSINGNFILSVYGKLLPQVLLNLNCVSEEDMQENNSLSVFSSASKCLISIFELIGNEACKITTDFIDAFSGGETWQKKVGSLSAFCFMLQGCDGRMAQDLVKQSWEGILIMLDNTNLNVKLTASALLIQMSRRCKQELVGRGFLDRNIGLLMQRIVNFPPKVAAQLCIFVEEL